MPRIYFPVAIVVVLLLSSCAKAPYWVKGLTLPPGSTVSDVSETTSPGGRRVLTVSFENAGGWAVVTTHVDRQMAAEGYQVTLSDLIRKYSTPGSAYRVALSDLGALVSAATPGSSPPDGMQGSSGFVLTVTGPE